MIENLKQILFNENALTILGFVSTIFVAFITAFLTSKNNSKNITFDNFKKEGIRIQERILKFWSSLLWFDFESCINNYKNSIGLKDKKNDTEILKLICYDAILYSSRSTIKSIGTYQYYIYKNNNANTGNKKNNQFQTMKILVISSRVIKKMKYDFTGEKADIIDLLKMRINDLNLLKIITARFLIIYYDIKENFFIISGIAILLIFILKMI